MFEKAYSCANATDPSLTCIFSGKYPVSHGITHHGLQVTKQEIDWLNRSGTIFLPEILKKLNYTTLAVDWMSRWHSRGYDYRPGSKKTINNISNFFKTNLIRFENIYKILGQMKGYLLRVRDNVFGEKELIEKADLVTNIGIDLIQKNIEKKFLLNLHYWDTHTPYFAPIEYIEKMRDEYLERKLDLNAILKQTPRKKRKIFLRRMIKNDPNEAISRYNAAIAHIDHQVGRLIKTLEENDLLKDTLIVLTSDHGESLIEHDIFFDHHGIYETTTHIPLIIKHPFLPKNVRVKNLVQHTDLVPTILDFLGLDVRKYNFDGRSFLKMMFDQSIKIRTAAYLEDVFTERSKAIVTEKYKYIHSPTEAGTVCKSCLKPHSKKEELYDLENDPEEKIDIANDNKKVTEQLKECLTQWITSLEKKKRLRQKIINVKSSLHKRKSY